jgi:hypothetical protein
MLQGWLADVSILQAVVVIGAFAAVVTFIFKAWPWVSRVKDFIDDLIGEPARPGVPARPGMMARLAAQEDAIEEVREAAQTAAYHSKPNGGESAFDSLMRELAVMSEQLSAQSTQLITHGLQWQQHLRQAAARDSAIAETRDALTATTNALEEVQASVAYLAENLPTPDDD